MENAVILNDLTGESKWQSAGWGFDIRQHELWRVVLRGNLQEGFSYNCRMTSISLPVHSENGCVRPLNILRDLPRVADLIELCFASNLDNDGKSYIREMRRASNDHSFLRWANHAVEGASMPLAGVVWEQDGRIVGNASLMPFRRKGVRYFLIANVATHPDYRGRGIARVLTEQALQPLVSAAQIRFGCMSAPTTPLPSKSIPIWDSRNAPAVSSGVYRAIPRPCLRHLPPACLPLRGVILTFGRSSAPGSRNRIPMNWPGITPGIGTSCNRDFGTGSIACSSSSTCANGLP